LRRWIQEILTTKDTKVEFDEFSNRVIGCAIEVHRVLGPGLLESAYEQCLAHELRQNDIQFKLQQSMPVSYKGIYLDCGYRIDILVEDCLIVELKCIDKLLGIHAAQLLTYIKLAHIKTGLLINFNNVQLKDGIKRLVL
jgi:GxxExxY protein